MKMFKIKLLTLLIAILLSSCNKNNEAIKVSPNDFYNVINKVIDILADAIFLHPVASSIIEHPNSATHEIKAKNNDEYKSLSNQLRGFSAIPEPLNNQSINFQLVTLIAHSEVSKALVNSSNQKNIKIYEEPEAGK